MANSTDFVSGQVAGRQAADDWADRIMPGWVQRGLEAGRSEQWLAGFWTAYANSELFD